MVTGMVIRVPDQYIDELEGMELFDRCLQLEQDELTQYQST